VQVLYDPPIAAGAVKGFSAVGGLTSWHLDLLFGIGAGIFLPGG